MCYHSCYVINVLFPPVEALMCIESRMFGGRFLSIFAKSACALCCEESHRGMFTTTLVITSPHFRSKRAQQLIV